MAKRTPGNELADYFAPRSDWLLFCIVAKGEIGFVDVRRHDEVEVFANP